MKIGFIGVGSMGRAIITLLVRAGHHVSAWNRSHAAIMDLEGVSILESPTSAFEQEVVISLLADDAAVREVLLSSAALENADKTCVHVVMSTLSPSLMVELQGMHDAIGMALVAAPVFGVPAVAANGELNILAAGSQQAVSTVQPLFDLLGKNTWYLGDQPEHACIAKIAGNMMITQAIQSLGEATGLVQRHGLSPSIFVNLMTQTLFACPSYHRYGQNIVNSSFEPGFKLSLGLKDINLAIDAGRLKDLELPAADAVRSKMTSAVARGDGHKDWSVFATQTVTQSTDHAQQPWRSAPIKRTRRGNFWVTGARVTQNGKNFQKGPMYVAWESPEHITQPYPVVLVHGGTLQGTEWLDTPDGRPGWAQRFLEAGFVVFRVDRPGHGRSPYHPDIMGPMGPAFSYERAREVYFPEGGGETQWPFELDDEAAFDAFIAAYGPMPADLAASQTLDADRLAELLDRIGKAIIVTHSASGPSGWLVADRRPDLIAGIVAVEPMGPVFGHTPGIGSLEWGLTAAPLTFDPPRATAEQVRTAEPSTLKIPGLQGVPVALVTGETSAFASYASSIVPFLRNAGANIHHLDLPALGIHGNGHGLIYERNSDSAFKVVTQWLEKSLNMPDPA
ncbi:MULTISPECIES: NAD(P)-binding domain-containing protein [unclassified Pseudomonas]|uniref:NAD(P)-binding domain-containing protein n=1 Tax=unclassified Pseudomonas TaxID=196821 RepID=UPI001842721A|nr:MULTISPECIES: NAD(P)-binding domain-containing protein [unclassified Pseudomonas]MBB6287490.1 3-hydroxyisobutyrate dehydrogenase-like beta-hydroxyacid dehydrogenase [Pseudomonas sp. SJZ073]MBB6310583.1 3-hydroxyisobutyrate dehydrogenase-like beta-hydroxyacid dehydrogenase [Pseudomonas sp. JAI120]